MTRQTTPDLLGDPIPSEDPSLATMFGQAKGDAREMSIHRIIVNRRLREIDIASVEELAKSIAKIGLLEPLVVNHDGALIAGRHRLEALRMLGWERVPVHMVTLSALDAELAEIDENLVRNELSVLERGEHLARRKEIYEELHPETKNGANGRRGKGAGEYTISSENGTSPFSEDTSAKIGTSRSVVEREVRIANKIDPNVRDMIRGTPVADRKRELMLMAGMDREDQLDVALRLLDGAGNVFEAVRQQQQERIETNIVALSSPWLLVGDFRTLGMSVPESSVDLIFTDPPYDEAASALFDDLAQFAARVLKPGGILLTYSGQFHLPQIYAAMGQHLQYMWTCAIGHGGGATWFRKWHLLNQWKPILMYGKPPIKTWWANSFADYVVGGKEKSDHEWQQALGEAIHYIQAVCPPGGVVCDPFLGSGTTAVAAKKLGMQYIGIEKDPTTAARARSRIELA